MSCMCNCNKSLAGSSSSSSSSSSSNNNILLKCHEVITYEAQNYIRIIFLSSNNLAWLSEVYSTIMEVCLSVL